MPMNPFGTQRTFGGVPIPTRRTTTAPTAPTTAPGTRPAAPQLPAGTDESLAPGTNAPEPLPTLAPVPAAPPSLPTVPTAGLPAVPTATPVNRPPQGETFGNLPPVPTTPIPATPPTGTNGPTLTPTDPNNPLTTQTIGAGAGMNRFDLARQQFDTFVQGTDPSYQAALRDAKRVGAAAGGLGSGQLRTNIGDLANTRANALDVKEKETFQDALLGSVDDARYATGLAERQQGFQSGQQQQVFENELRRLGFDDQMLNSAIGRALQTWMAGQAGGTGSDTVLAGANRTAGQAAGGQDALDELIRALMARQTGGSATVPPGTMVPTTGGIANG